ncbi:MAG: hypothetical protein J6D06_06795 [Clostridia bacterium]|nr:hypothetical protein [Clostridia bacterium]
MSDYTYSEIMKMQNDAIKRVEDMQKKARKTAGLEKEMGEKNQNGVPVQKPERVPMPNDYLEKLKNYAINSSHTEKEENRENHTVERHFPSQGTGSSGFLSDFNMDEDKALLLSLIMLLSEEKGDELLIMALIYMLT